MMQVMPSDMNMNKLPPVAMLSELAASEQQGSEVIATRFGRVVLDSNRAVQFPYGLLGFPEKVRFALANMPSAKMEQFKLLQSLDDHSLSFITLPLGLENQLIAQDHILSACRDLEIAPTDLALLLIVSVHRTLQEVKLSVNVRAPLFIDATRKLGAQFVFPQNEYKVQHYL